MPAAKKHLVLDAGTHSLLTERKELTNTSLKEIGNAALRQALQGDQLTSAIGKVLVSSGKLSEDEFSNALGRASEELLGAGRSPVEDSSGGTLTSGSWAIHHLATSSDTDFQVLECWTRDSNQQPTPPHRHDADEFVIVFGGRLLITMNGIAYTLGPRNVIQIPAGCVHSATPLRTDCHLLAVAYPSIPEYKV